MTRIREPHRDRDPEPVGGIPDRGEVRGVDLPLQPFVRHHQDRGIRLSGRQCRLLDRTAVAVAHERPPRRARDREPAVRPVHHHPFHPPAEPLRRGGDALRRLQVRGDERVDRHDHQRAGEAGDGAPVDRLADIPAGRPLEPEEPVGGQRTRRDHMLNAVEAPEAGAARDGMDELAAALGRDRARDHPIEGGGVGGMLDKKDRHRELRWVLDRKLPVFRSLCTGSDVIMLSRQAFAGIIWPRLCGPGKPGCAEVAGMPCMQHATGPSLVYHRHVACPLQKAGCRPACSGGPLEPRYDRAKAPGDPAA